MPGATKESPQVQGLEAEFRTGLKNAVAVGIVGISEVLASRTRACSSAIRCARAVPIRQLVGGAIEAQLEVRVPIGE